MSTAAVAAPRSGVTMMLVLLLLMLCAPVEVFGSAAYLLAQRRGAQYRYEAVAGGNNISAFLPNASFSYLYSFTPEMNVFIQKLHGSSALRNVTSFEVEDGFDNCVSSSTNVIFNVYFFSTGCFKAQLHTGIASDCVSVNPFCCVMYWRYPASLPDRLPTNQIDPRLVFWDGTKAVNGFYTNFSAAYRASNANCSTFEVFPSMPGRVATPVTSVDPFGEWRFTSRDYPAFTFVEQRLSNPVGNDVVQLTLMRDTANPVWAETQQFGNIPLVAPIALSAGLVAVLLLLLLVLYLCGYRPGLKEEAVLRTKIEDLVERTAQVQEKLAARRSGSCRRSNSSLAQTARGSVVTTPKSSPSPMQQNRTSSMNVGMPQQEYVFPTELPPPHIQQQQQQQQLQLQNSFTNAALARQSASPHLPPPSRTASMTARNRVGAEHRRPPSRTGGACRQDSRSCSPVASAFDSAQQNPILRRSGSATSAVSSASRRTPHSFDNPLVGRQTFET